ncbi:hypothetical protein SAMN05216249_10913 [Acetitomaculum ruminis DSM 5522]|uniref:Uncharacterized protein n=1 Tax=Acetitomaculum ruminis DSM 5522 TaxID=1120918 RepID=A0A1I0YA34_9FIRM|nr:hypothetical protein [Acetitomaculum ruminis]SFB09380.1 hypothetical protein SAMN05216249_10913 [Acetitomaculum ruminis DSM 5522]
MDKYEFQLKLDEIKRLVRAKDFVAASKIADEIEMDKVKSINLLTNLSYVYERVGKYFESRDLLLRAYDLAPKGKAVLYRLTNISIKLKEFNNATAYYSEFANVAPEDTRRFILRYKLLKFSNAPVAEQVDVLEKYKEHEFNEKWLYELAYLYHKAGKINKCVEQCDELFLWFGEGKYVDRALELKMLYETLTPIQLEYYEKAKMKTTDEKTEKSANDLNIKPIEITTSKFNTSHLQEELAKSMQTIINATEKETVNFTINNIKNMVEHSNSTREGHVFVDNNSELVEKYRSILEKEIAGNLDFDKKKDKYAKDENKKSSIQEVLKEWEQTKKRAEEAILKEEKKNFEEAKAKAIEEAENIINDISGNIPVIEKQQEKILKDIKKKSKKHKSYEVKPLEIKNAKVNKPDGVKEVKSEDGNKTEDKSIELLEKAIEEAEEVFVDNEQRLIDEEESTLESIINSNENKEERAYTYHMDENVKKIFTYFMQVRGMEEQLDSMFTALKLNVGARKDSTKNNIVITGGTGSGKTKLGTNIVKAIRKEFPGKQSKVGKVSGEKLNNKEIRSLIKKLEGGYLIIEKAGDLLPEKVKELSKVMEGKTGGLTVIMEDEIAPMTEMLSKAPKFAKKFNININIPKFNNDELIEFSKEYVKEHNFKIEEMGILALYTRLGKMRYDESQTSLDEVIEILDHAMQKASSTGLGRRLGNLFSKDKDEDGFTIIREKDIE